MKQHKTTITLALVLTLAAQILLVQTASATTFQTLTKYEFRVYGSQTYLFPITPAAINPDYCSLAGGLGYVFYHSASTGNLIELVRGAAINDKPIVIALDKCHYRSGKPVIRSVSVISG